MEPLKHHSNQAIDHVSALRSHDIYHPDMNANEVITRFFPSTVPDLVLNLSDITSTFYGQLLQQIYLLQGSYVTDAISQAAIAGIGRIKTDLILQQYPDLERDARTVLLILLSAIFTSSPEYRFQVKEFTPRLVKVDLSGKDRYHRITNKLGFAQHLTWPVIIPFLKTAAVAVSPRLTVDAIVKELNDNSDCLYEITIKADYNVSADTTAVTTLAAPFFQLPAAPMHSYGNLLQTTISNASAFAADNFPELLKNCISMEAYNASRINQSAGASYILGNKLHVSRYPEIRIDNTLNVSLVSRQLAPHRYSSTFIITNNNNEPAYTMLFDYYALDETSFQSKFGHLKNISPQPGSGVIPPLPRLTRMNFTDPYAYRILLNPFTAEHCQGHFVNYPCVPTVLLSQCLLNEAIAWLTEMLHLPEIRPVVDDIAMFPNKLMTIETTYLVYITVHRLSRKSFRFTNIIRTTNDPETIYATISLDLETPQ
ncbi:MAG TPA: hypothetical protein VM802_23745 [Chitinophaga sp.]|uniref:hypothetical protein n=1 Tax=Chitinophaga sp. TaxID=1869181 RepID=UPI002B6831BD|nr:hypothetical protein [Chitinophaga sp.]HVI47902.1 hypothetical protein [Chitinophaga sp.]